MDLKRDHIVIIMHHSLVKSRKKLILELNVAQNPVKSNIQVWMSEVHIALNSCLLSGSDICTTQTIVFGKERYMLVSYYVWNG